MKTFHLFLVAIFTFTLCMSAITGNALAVAEKKEVAASADKPAAPAKVAAEDKNTAKTAKSIPKDVNINTADKETLIQLPGIGPVTADAIIAYRKDNGNFKNNEELTKVKGIGDKTLARIKPYLLAI